MGRPGIVMVGTSLDTRGGISAVVKAWEAGGLFGRWAIEYVESHCDGSRLDKLLCALNGFAVMVVLAIRHRDALVHVHAASRASFWRKAVFMMVAMLAGWKYIFHLHGGGFARFYENECGPVGRAAVRFFLRHAAAIVVVSARWATWVRSITQHPQIVTVGNAVTVPSAVDTARESALVAFIGRCDWTKGTFELLEAVATVQRRIPDIHVEFAGDGNLEAVAHQAEQLGIGDRVRLHGWLPQAERDALLARATVLVLPSHAEGLPMSLLEAMAAGCPVIASSVGGIPDVVRDGENGLLVPPQDPAALAAALSRVLSDPALAARLGREGRATIEHDFNLDQSLETLEQLYAGLGADRAPARAQPSTGRLQEIS